MDRRPRREAGRVFIPVASRGVAARLATITSAARSSSPSHSKPARDSAITHPSATDGSSRVATARATAGEKGRPTVGLFN
jgi:hypothetical protein